MAHNTNNAPMTYASVALLDRVRSAPVSQSELAATVKLRIDALSKILNRRVPVRLGHPKIAQLGQILGLDPAAVFDPVDQPEDRRTEAPTTPDDAAPSASGVERGEAP